MASQRWIAAVVVILCAGLIGQGGHNKTLIVNGKVVPSGILRAKGKMYVDIEDLAHTLGTSVTLHTDSVMVTLPGENPTTSAQIGADRLSPEFQRAAVTALSQMREFKGVMEAVVQQGTPIGGPWIQKFETDSRAALAHTSVAVSTEGDHRALPLLQHAWGQLETWAHTIAAERKAMNATRSMNEDALANDPALAKLSECGGDLSQMVASGTFREIAACR